jgi:hypothetical protein
MFMRMAGSTHQKMICGCMAIKESAATTPKSTIEKLTDSVNGRLFEDIKRHGAHVNK